MKYVLKFVFIFFILGNLSAQNPTSPAIKGWWNEAYPTPPKVNTKAKKMPLVRVVKNKFIDSKGDTLLFRGLSISDPDKIEAQGHWGKPLFKSLQDMGVKLVRIPIHPVAWRNRGPQKYMMLLDSAVNWCTDYGMYVIIDWHTIGNLKTEMFQDPMYETTQKETFDFWRRISRHFNGNNTVAFYELFNEPTTYRGQLGNIAWSDWKKINEDMIKIIRAHDPDKIALVAGFDWAYDLTPLREEPINATNIGYVSHPYPFKRTQPWPDKWEEDYGFAASQYPIVATEISFGLRPGTTIDANHYGHQITKYLESRGMSWCAWVFDPEWGPALLKSWNGFELSEVGKFFKEAMVAPEIKVKN
jgi:endoglucanase